MKKSSPISFPYSNKHGQTFTELDVSNVAYNTLRKYAPRKGLDFGLELWYVILWAMDEVHEGGVVGLEKLVRTVFYRTTGRKTYDERLKSYEELPEDLPKHEDHSVRELRISYEQLTELPMIDLLALDKKAKQRMVAKLRSKVK